MALHLGRMTAITLLILLFTFYPFLPGKYDGLAVALSGMAQMLGVAGLLLVPIGIIWLAHELRKRGKIRRGLPHGEWGYHFAVASVAASSVIAVAASLGAAATVGLSLGFLVFALWLYTVSRLIPRLKLLRNAERGSFNPAPLYLTFIPVAVLLCQLTLGGRAVEFSRNHAIDSSAALVDELEKYHAAHGRYPGSLLAVWPDFYPSVIGIERFHYAPLGDAYNLFFEQSTFIWGTREFVMYNKLDEHVISSHAAWILMGPPEELRARQGWYAVHDAARPHWKYFWFD